MTLDWRRLPWRRLGALLAGVLAIWGTWTYGAALDRTYPVKDWLFWRIALLWLYNLVLVAACTSFGHLVVSRLVREELPALETLVHSMATGLLGFALAMYVGGALGWYHLWFAIALPVAFIAAGAVPFWRFCRRAIAEWKANRGHGAPAPLAAAIGTAAAVYGVICLALVYLPLITPDAIEFDAAWSHLVVAQDYAHAGRIVPFVADYARALPALTSVVHTWGWLLPVPYLTQRWTMPLHTEFMVVLWTLAGIAAAVRWLLDDEPIRWTWVAFFLFPSIFVYDKNIGGAADHFLAFFVPPLFLATGRAIRRFERGWCVLVGAYAAGAFLTKYQALYPIAGVGLAFVVGWAWHVVGRLRDRRSGQPDKPDRASWRALVVGPLLVLAAGVLLGSANVVRNWIFYRDPVYPLALHVFTHARPTTPHAAFYVESLYKGYGWRPHGGLWHRLQNACQIFATFSFKPHYSFTKNWPDFGGLFTFSLPLLLFIGRRPRIWLGALAASAGVFVWAAIYYVDRNLQCMVPLLVAVTCAILIRAWQLGWLARAGIVPLVALQLIWGGDALFYSQRSRIDSAMKLISSGYDGRRKGERFEYGKAWRDINRALPPDATLVIHNLRRTLGIKARVWEDMPGQQGKILYEGLRSPRELYDYYRKLGVTNLLHIPGARPICSKHDDTLFNAFINTRAVTHRRFGGYELLTLTNLPPPGDHPWKVAALGLRGYRDGLYGIVQMQVYECLPRDMQHYPHPVEAMPRDPAAVAALFGKADAVVVGRRARLTTPERNNLATFRRIASYADHTIYMRR